MDKTTLVKVVNRSGGNVGYKVPELNVRRQFAPREVKEIPFEEIEQLSFIPGGASLLKNYLVIRDQEALEALGFDVEPEYFYTEDDIKDLLVNGTYDQFLDCLDFAPSGVLETIKKLAVSLPLNDVDKREAILKKLGFDVTQAINIQEVKFDGETQEPQQRRTTAVEPARRTSTPSKYKIVKS